MIEPKTEPQSVRFMSAAAAAMNKYAQISADADTAGMRARIARLERDRATLLMALDVSIALYDEVVAEYEGHADV